MGRTARALAGAIGVGGLLVAFTILFAAPTAAQDPGGGQPRVTVCHREGNGTFHEITIAQPALPAHLAHGDIYPVPAGGCPTGVVGGTTRVTICHREGNGTFHEITIDDNALPAHLAHGDIYPVPAGGCPTTTVAPPPTVVGGTPGGVVGGVSAPPVVRQSPPVTAAAAPMPARPTVVAGASAAPVQELPHTGARDVVLELAVAVGLLLVGTALLKGSSWVAATPAVPGSVWMPLPVEDPEPPTPTAASAPAVPSRTALILAGVAIASGMLVAHSSSPWGRRSHAP